MGKKRDGNCKGKDGAITERTVWVPRMNESKETNEKKKENSRLILDC